MATCTNSQPMPRTRLRAIPVMRWPTRPIRPSFLTSRCTKSPGPRPLIALDGDRRLERGQPRQALAPHDPRDRRGTELQGLGNLRPGPALPAQVRHPARQQRRGHDRTPPRATRAIGQPRGRLPRIPRHPLAHRPFTHAHRGGYGRGPFALGQHARHDLASTPGRRPGILMDVHPGLLLCGDGRLATTSFAGETRMDNLLTVHS